MDVYIPKGDLSDVQPADDHPTFAKRTRNWHVVIAQLLLHCSCHHQMLEAENICQRCKRTLWLAGQAAWLISANLGSNKRNRLSL